MVFDTDTDTDTDTDNLLVHGYKRFPIDLI